jgi:uncharacterized phiE125 gp8 family phage protein
MGMYKITAQPQSEPITLAEAKDWLKIHPDVLEDDDLIRGLISAARNWAEKGTGRILITQTVVEVWDEWQRCFDLSVGPLNSSTVTFEYRNSAGTYVTLASTDYTVDDVSEPGRVMLKNNISLSTFGGMLSFPNIVKITYNAGKDTALEIDANIKTAMLLQIGLMYENREDMPLGKNGNAMARSAWALLSLSRLNML